jgi:hypothetical protein
MFGSGVVVIALIAAAFAFLPVLMTFGGCTTSEQVKSASPDGRYIASQIFKDCGATDGVEWVALRSAGKSIDVNEVGEVFYITPRMRNISLRWSGPKAVIIHYEDMSEPSDPSFDTYQKLPKLDHWQDVHIKYQKMVVKAKPL